MIPASRCPSCNHPIRAWDNIPVISYVILRGRCRHCRTKISFQYPLVEALNAFFYVAVFWRYGLSCDSVAYALFCSCLLVITFIDIEFQIIPDRITLPGIILGAVAGALLMPDPFMRTTLLGYRASVIGLLSGGGFFYLVAVLSKGGMGGGDIKMMAMVGALMGWKAVMLTTFLGSLSGSIVGVFLMIFRGRGRKAKIPFGPFLALGAAITLFFGEEILSWYLH